jgi:hypothetical protein
MKKQTPKFLLNKGKVVVATLGFTAVSLFSCKKTGVDREPTKPALKTLSAQVSLNEFVFGPNTATTDYRYTELGRQYGPVFSVENVMEAWNQLSTKRISSLEPTHLYIKFTPSSIDELKAITDANIPVYTLPETICKILLQNPMAYRRYIPVCLQIKKFQLLPMRY